MKQNILQTPRLSLLLTACATCIGGAFQYGYNISIVNSPSKYVMTFINQTWTERYESAISQELLTLFWSIIVSIFTLGGLVGSWVGGTLAIKYGRKGAMLINNIFALLAAAFVGISYFSRLFELLVVSRLLSGINGGVSLCVQTLYLTEIAPRALRGALATSTSISLTLGIFVAQVVGLQELLGREEWWALLLATTAIPAILQLITLPWCPESPRYLLIDRGDETACDKALKHLHGEAEYPVEKADIEQERLEAEGVKSKNPWELFMDKSLRWQLLSVIILQLFHQLNGINAIYFYASYVFTEAGIPEDKILYVTLGSGLSEFFTAVISGFLVESLGRKVLVIGGYSLMSVWCLGLTLTLSFSEASPWVPYLSMACVFAFILSFGLGPGGVTGTLNSELFTQTVRPAACMIGLSVNWISFFIISIAFPFVVSGLKQYCFLVFLAVCVIVSVYTFFMVPETKNKTFLEIQAEFKSKEKEQKLILVSDMYQSTSF
ncbi:solute carrier family 2, facilitated glucose transporter member 11-like isoform X2 [Engraulis encrasicolus]|uniref:solute carrier family 2, facilitated glucose transporter member 11-like isoform X2 n=1 Tax=Engraulis encrasicolus TaxID=184585 RepID=UPI002FD5711D